MDFRELVARRRSVRAFDSSVSVAPDKLEQILDSARMAPSAGNLQSFRVIAVFSQSARRSLAEAALGQAFVAEAPLVLVFCADGDSAARKYGRRGVELYSVQDATIACTFAMLAAADLGLGSVWVGAFDEEAVRRAVGIGSTLRPVALLPIGLPREFPNSRSRLPVEQLVERL